jgi:NAD(P)-dependent dehydrogenase (short-subunit alcohol dehydrogenase family)
MVELNGVGALVTGGASGLGAAAARALRDRGAKVAVVDLAGDGAPDGCKFERADVTDPDELRAAIERVARQAPLRVCVNCAGVAPAGRTIREPGQPLPLEEFERAVCINLVGTFNAVRLAAAAMAPPPDGSAVGGVIVNTASIAAFDGQIGQAAYAASKAGVAGMTLPIARDLAKFGIRVCAIAPGVFDTPMMAGMSDEIRDSLSATVPLPSRMGIPDEFGRLVVDIAENDYLNGETIRLDGAVRMPPR